MELAVLHPATHDSSTRQGLNLPPAIVRLLEAVERSLTSENSRRAYRTSLLHFFVWCGSGKADGTFSRLSVLQFKDDLIGAGKTLENGEWKRRYAPATVNQRLASVRALAQEAADAGLIDQSAAAAIRRVRGEKQSGSTIGNWLQKAQVDELLMAVDRKSLRGNVTMRFLPFFLRPAFGDESWSSCGSRRFNSGTVNGASSGSAARAARRATSAFRIGYCWQSTHGSRIRRSSKALCFGAFHAMGGWERRRCLRRV